MNRPSIPSVKKKKKKKLQDSAQTPEKPQAEVATTFAKEPLPATWMLDFPEGSAPAL